MTNSAFFVFGTVDTFALIFFFILVTVILVVRGCVFSVVVLAFVGNEQRIWLGPLMEEKTHSLVMLEHPIWLGHLMKKNHILG